MRTGVLWWALKATERLPWLTLDAFFAADRAEQIVLLVYAQERDREDVERSAATMIPIPFEGGKK